MPSSASVAVIRYGTASPKENTWPFCGSWMLTFGAVLPTVTVTLAVAVLPVLSRTVSVTM